MGNFAETYKVKEGDKVSFELKEKGGYLTEWEIRQLIGAIIVKTMLLM